MDPETVLELADAQAMQYPSVVIEYPFGPGNAVYKVRGKMFMMQYVLRGVPSINLKIDPLDGEVLRDAYAEITPGYHMSKKHWITVAGVESGHGSVSGCGGPAGEVGRGAGGGVGAGAGVGGQRLDEELLHDLVLESYLLVVAGLPKKNRPVDPTTFGR